MRTIFESQSKIFAQGETMLDDLAIRGIQKGFSRNEIISAIKSFYNQCDEVAENIFCRAEKFLK
jgi:hypothetical protein